MARPEELKSILSSLPLRTGLYIPDDLLEDWFGQGGSPPSLEDALPAASSFGRECDSEFEHDAERKEGVFWKWVPAI